MQPAPEIVRVLEDILDRAKRGEVYYLVASIIGPRGGEGTFCGRASLSSFARTALDSLLEQMDQQIPRLAMPPRDPNVTADHVTLNVKEGWICYDFIAWLIDAEMTRIREGAPAPLKVAFWMGDGKLDAFRKTMFDNVIRPSLALIGAVEEPDCGGRTKLTATFSAVSEAVARGEAVPMLKSGRAALDGKPPVTITLREANTHPHRNSNVAEWLRFADYLRARGERVVVVRDTARADWPFDEYETSPEASRDILSRVALYESAKANFFVSNGPATLAWFTQRPWLMFMQLTDDDHPYLPQRRSIWPAAMGIAEGEQLPWAKPDQRIVWKPETFENMVSAWSDL